MTNVTMMNKVEILQKLPKGDAETQNEQILLEKRCPRTHGLARRRLAPDLPFVESAVKAEAPVALRAASGPHHRSRQRCSRGSGRSWPSVGPGPPMAACDGAAEGGTAFASLNKHQHLLVRTVVTTTRHAFSAGGRGGGCRGHAVALDEIQTRQTWCVSPGGARTMARVPSTPADQTPAPLPGPEAPRTQPQGHILGASSVAPARQPRGSSGGSFLSSKRDDLGHYKIKAPNRNSYSRTDQTESQTEILQ